MSILLPPTTANQMHPFDPARRQIRSKASRGANWQKRRSSAARILPTARVSTAGASTKKDSLSDTDFFISGGSTARGVFIPALQHTFK